MSNVGYVDATLKGKTFRLQIPRAYMEFPHPADALRNLEGTVGSLLLCLRRFGDGEWRSSDVTCVLEQAAGWNKRKAFAAAWSDLSLMGLAPLAALVIEAHLAGLDPERAVWPAPAKAPPVETEAA